MKNKFILVIATLTTLMLAACGGPVNNSSSAGGSSKSSSKISSVVPSSSKHTHAWDAGTVTKAPTCDVEGEKAFACSGCTETKTEPVAALGHTWGAAVAHASETDTDYSIKSCSVCNKKDVFLNALDYTAITGTNKDSSGVTLKLSKNGDFTEYSFAYDAALSGKIYVYGWVDYWKDGSNNNDQRGFNSRKEGEGFNLEVTVNSTVVTITNTKTYEQMGMTAGEGTNGSFTLCELGAASLINGVNTLKYQRTESYNLNITEIHFIG